MSCYTAVYALESKIIAPEIGDAGHVGCPPVNSDAGQHPFNLIYTGLKCAGLTTIELDGFNEFLEKYGNERLYFFVEGDDDSDDAKRLEEIYKEYDIPKYQMYPGRRYTKCKYKISSGEYSYTSIYDDLFEKIDKFIVEKKDLKELIENVFCVEDWKTNFYNLGGIIDPFDGDLENIKKFILNQEGPFTIEFLP